MTRMILVNLPVTDLKASMAFYKSIGFKNNPQFTDDTAACRVWSDAINVMLLTHAKWHHSRVVLSRPQHRAKCFLRCPAIVERR